MLCKNLRLPPEAYMKSDSIGAFSATSLIRFCVFFNILSAFPNAIWTLWFSGILVAYIKEPSFGFDRTDLAMYEPLSGSLKTKGNCKPLSGSFVAISSPKYFS